MAKQSSGGDKSRMLVLQELMRAMTRQASENDPFYMSGNAVGDMSAPAGFGYSKVGDEGSFAREVANLATQALAMAVPAVRASDDPAQMQALEDAGAPSKATSIMDAVSIALSTVPMLQVPQFAQIPLTILSLIEDAVSGESSDPGPGSTNPGALEGFGLGEGEGAGAEGSLGGAGSLDGSLDSGFGMGSIADAAAAGLAGAIADAQSSMGLDTDSDSGDW